MTVAQVEKKRFLQLKSDEIFRVNVRKNHPTHLKNLDIRLAIIDKLNLVQSEEEKRSVQFMKWVQQRANTNYYFSGLTSNAEALLLKKNWNLFIMLKLCRPSPDTTAHYINAESVIEIDHIVSTKKGEAYKTMKSVIALSEKINCPITLWAETLENVKYFERYGFKDYGQVGNNNEHLMILDRTINNI